jgi:hypothetical protein
MLRGIIHDMKREALHMKAVARQTKAQTMSMRVRVTIKWEKHGLSVTTRVRLIWEKKKKNMKRKCKRRRRRLCKRRKKERRN